MKQNLVTSVLTHVLKSLYPDCDNISAVGETTLEKMGLVSDDITVLSTFFGHCCPLEFFSGRSNLCLEVADNAVICNVYFGNRCTDPELATEYADRYMNTRWGRIWSIDDEFDPYTGMTLTTSFSAFDEKELRENLTERLSLFDDDRFSNELRPFIHYFEN